MPDTMCSAPDCPAAARCRRHQASGAVPVERGQRFDVWHWRRDSFSDRVVCNGLVVAPEMAEVANA